jgi:hypothetical protein
MTKQDILDYFSDINYAYNDCNKHDDLSRMLDELIETQPKIGEWLEKEVNSDKVDEWQSARCSVCNRYHTTPYMYYFSHYEYCPNCGAKMEA